MGEPLTRMETAGEGVLVDAALRLDRALQALEAALGAAAPSSARAASSAQVVELEVARWRGRELEAAAADASLALGRAVAEVQRVLQDGGTGAEDPQTSLFAPGLLDDHLLDDRLREGGRLDSPLESEDGLADDEETGAAEPTPEKEPAA